MKKLTQEYVTKEFNKQGYVLEDVYTSSKTPMKCIFEGYIGCLSYDNLKLNKSFSKFGFSNPYWKNNVKKNILNKYGNVDIISIDKITKSKKNRIIITFRCECGKITQKLFEYNRNRNKYFLCKKCTEKKRGVSHRGNINEALDCFKKNGYILINPPNTFRRDENLLAKDKNGYIGYISYNRLQQKRNMGIFERTNKDNYIYNVNNYCKLNTINVKALSFSENQKWTRTGIKFKCSCGNEFETSISSFQNGKFRCDKCAKSISRFEESVISFLIDNHIEYIFQYCFNSCRDILPLPFDFYLKKYKMVIEVDGQQHTHPTKFSNISNDEMMNQFNILKKHDKIKTNFCKHNKIPLLRVSYKDILNNSYKEKIIQFIKD